VTSALIFTSRYGMIQESYILMQRSAMQLRIKPSRVQLKCDGTRRRTGEAVKGETWRMEWVASTLHTTSKHVVSSITTADAHSSAASIRLN
jgi:hypothetical protein